MKEYLRPFLVILLFFTTLSIYTKIAGPIPFSISSVTTNKSDAFTVTGTGEVNTTPTVATVNAGIESQGPTVKAAQDQINSVINKVSENIKKLGVQDEDIKTANYNINPNYDFQSGSSKINGYRANTTLTIKINQLDKINNIIDAATLAGANQVSNITFDINDKTKAENEARQKAVADARKKAEEAAKIAGFSLGRLINYSENFNDQPRPYPLTAKALGTGSTQNDETKIEPGSTAVNVTVTLSYEIR